MTDEQNQVLKTLYGHKFGEIVRKLGHGGMGAAYLADLTNPLHLLAGRIVLGEESPRLLGLDSIIRDEQELREINDPDLQKMVYDAAHKMFMENGPPHDKKPASALETYTMLLTSIDRALLKHQHEDHFNVVVKLLKQQDNEEARKRFNHEANLLKKLDHKNIVKLFGVVDAQTVGKCLILEHVDGDSLEDYLKKQPDHRIAPEPAVNLMVALLEPIDYMHKQGVIHRDLKPSNIVLRPDISPVIIDFGIGKDIDTNLTMIGSRMGTPGYMAPELLRDGITETNVTREVDVYALGILFYEMLAGRRAYEGSSAAEIADKAMARRHPARLTEFAGSISDDIVYLVEAARAKDVSKRLTMEQFRERLGEIREKKMYGRPIGFCSSTTILLREELVKVGALAKIYTAKEEEIGVELASRVIEDHVADINSIIEVGLFAQAREKLDEFLKYNKVADTRLRQQLENLSESVNKGLAQQEVRKHLGETKRRIREKDYVGAEAVIETAKKHIDVLSKEEHPDIHEEFQALLNDYDTKHRMGVSVVKSLQNVLESAKSLIADAGRLYCEGKPVEHEKLGTMHKQLVDTESLATKITGVAEMPLYQELRKESAGVQGALQKLQAYISAYAALAGINDLCEGMLSLGAAPEKGQVDKLVKDFDNVQNLIAAIEQDKNGQLYEKTSARVKEVHGKLESLINKV